MLSKEFRPTQTFLIDLAIINNCSTKFINSLGFSKCFSDIHQAILQSPEFKFGKFSKFMDWLYEKVKEEKQHA